MDLMKPEKFTQRNIFYGERGARKKRSEMSEYAGILQGLKNQGLLDVLQEGQEFRRPEQAAKIAGMHAQTEGTRLENVGERFYQGIAEQYGPTAMRQSLGLPEPESRSNVFFSDRVPDLKPKSSMSGTQKGGYTGTWEESDKKSVDDFEDFKNILSSLGRKKKSSYNPFGVAGVRG